MGLSTGSITESLKENGRRFIKFIGLGRDDVKKHRAIAPWGDESAPIEGAVCIYGPTQINGESVVLGYINQVAFSDLKPGERRLFSTDKDGAEQIYVLMTDTGNIEFGAADDNLVRYLELKAAFDELKTDLNNHITNYNTHIHTTTATIGPTVVPGVISPTTSTSSASAADMSDAKIDELQCSG